MIGKRFIILQEGYREGLDAGQESTLQDGFNKGFALATSLLFNIAELRGEIRLVINCVC